VAGGQAESGRSSSAPHRPGESKRQRALTLREGASGIGSAGSIGSTDGSGSADGAKEQQPGAVRIARKDGRGEERDFDFRVEGPKLRRIEMSGGFL
jgi:hypothetical protein